MCVSQLTVTVILWDARFGLLDCARKQKNGDQMEVKVKVVQQFVLNCLLLLISILNTNTIEALFLRLSLVLHNECELEEYYLLDTHTHTLKTDDGGAKGKCG